MLAEPVDSSQVGSEMSLGTEWFGPVRQPRNVNGKRRDPLWFGSPVLRNSGKTSAPHGTGRETVVIPTSALVSSRGARDAAFGPATERLLSGQSSGFEEPMVRPHEGTCVGCDQVDVVAAR